MRIGYFAHWSGGPGTGVFYKIVAHVSDWAQRGHSVSLAVLTRDPTSDLWREALPPGVDFTSATYANAPQRLLAPARLWSWLRARRPEVIYFRADAWSPGLARTMRSIPTVVEVNSDDAAEARLRRGCGPMIRRVLRRRIFSNAAGIVFVAPELQRSTAFADVTIRSCVITNGIDLGAVQPVTPVAMPGLRFLMLASPGQSWQGIDLLPRVLDSRPDWEIDLAGVAGHHIPGIAHPRLRTHGALRRDQIEHLAAQANAGLGTLALFRKGLEQAASLKHREYLAMGLPVVLGCDDPDIPADASWAFRVDNSATGLLEKGPAVEEFVRDWRGRRVAPDCIRHLGTEVKEAQRLEFIQSVVDHAGASR